MNYKLRKVFTRNPELALQEILFDRGVEDVEYFMYPNQNCELDAHNLENIGAAADMLLKHLKNNSRICFVVDSDCDGFTSSAILWNYIKSIYPNSDLNFTVHERKQHGLSDKIDWFIEEEQFDLIILPDAGSYDVKYHERLAAINTDVLCLDHHEQMYDEDKKPIIATSPNTIVVNNQLSPNYKNKSLCGAGVVYKFCQILDETLGIDKAQDYLDLVALGEIADVMSRTTCETNYLMMKGLKQIKNKGFKALLEAQSFSLKDKASYPYLGLTPIDVAFYIAPPINAITRVGSLHEKETMFYAFIEPDRLVKSTKRGAKDGDTETAAGQTARVGANAKNRQNKLKEKALDLIDFKIQKEDLLENNILIIEVEDEDNIPQELGGLVAMAVVTKYNKPCLIVRRNNEGLLQGSGRNNENFQELPELKTFLENSGFFEYCAGHANAHGCGINISRLPSFLQYANSALSKEAFKNCYIVDYIFENTGSDFVNLGFALADNPEYFGNGIPEIKIVVKNIPLANILVMGADKSSIKITSNGVDFVKFKDTDFIQEVQENRTKSIEVYGRLNLNEWAGKKSLQVFIDDYSFQEDNTKYDF
jgi:single-stranded-DNA-specific exonuclease